MTATTPSPSRFALSDCARTGRVGALLAGALRVLRPSASSTAQRASQATPLRRQRQIYGLDTRHRFLLLAAALLCLFVGPALAGRAADTLRWLSPATGETLECRLLEPATPSAQPPPLAFYLLHLACERLGQETDDALLAELRASGCRVVVVDYRHHARARVPFLAADTHQLRRDLFEKKLLSDRPFDRDHVFILAEGCRLVRDVPYYADGARTLALDLIVPAKPRRPVGTLLEFSCDNQNRFGLYSLVFCTDTFVDTAGAAGYAAALADHPVAAPYKGFDPLPECGYKVAAAARTVRSLAATTGTNGRIAALGFSRGSGMALLLAATGGRPPGAGRGFHGEVPGDIQAAVVLSGRFDYTDLLPTDAMIPRYEKAWGPRATNLDHWRSQGAATYLTKDLVPLFLSINATEGADALHQMDVLRRRLDSLGVAYQWHPETEPRGHKMPVDPALLTDIHQFIATHLAH